jgi:hypothetical protein
MGDMNIGTKTITGLNPYQEIVCEVLDVSQKITVNGKTPLTQKFLADSPSTDRTTYESIDIATDIDINSLTSLTSPDVNNDEMIIYDSDTQKNKKITPSNLFFDTTYQGGSNISISTSTTPHTINLDKDVTVDNIKIDDELNLQGNDLVGGNVLYTSTLSTNDATLTGLLRVYDSNSGTITDTFSGATGSNSGIISNLNTTFFINGITGGTAPKQIEGGAFFAPSGSGSGQTGFNSSLAPNSTPNYFLFTGNNTRQLTTININAYLSKGGTISCYYIQGNSSNGGENADPAEDLVMDTLGQNYNILKTTTISTGSTSYVGNIFSLFTHTLTSTETTSGYYIRFRQTSSSQSTFDTYGIKWFNFQYGALGGTDIRFENLPTSSPIEAGRLWNNNGVLYVA